MPATSDTRAQAERATRLIELAATPHLRAHGGARFDIDGVRRLLDLPPLEHADLLQPDRWLAGGRLLRWLNGDDPGADYDLWFPTRRALRELASDLTARGCGVARASTAMATSWSFLRYRARVLVSRLRRRPHPWAPPPFARWDDPDAVAWLDEVAYAPWLLLLELFTPDGDRLQLVGGVLRPTPEDLIATFDYTICQIAMDDRYLYVGPRTLVDLAERRLRLDCADDPPRNLRRLLKYLRRGYRPDVRTLVDLARGFGRRPAAPAPPSVLAIPQNDRADERRRILGHEERAGLP